MDLPIVYPIFTKEAVTAGMPEQSATAAELDKGSDVRRQRAALHACGPPFAARERLRARQSGYQRHNGKYDGGKSVFQCRGVSLQTEKPDLNPHR